MWPFKQQSKARNYINLDGSPYGFEGFKRFSGTPVIQATALVAVVQFAAHMVKSPAKAFDIIQESILVYILQGMGLDFFNKRLPVPESSVIDKSGFLTSDPLASIKMREYYRKAGLVLCGVQASAISMSTAVTIAKYGYAQAPDLLGSNLYDPGVPLVILDIGWCFWASRQLRMGNWTIQTTPPGIQEKAAETVPEGATAPAQQLVSVKPAARLG